MHAYLQNRLHLPRIQKQQRVRILAFFKYDVLGTLAVRGKKTSTPQASTQRSLWVSHDGSQACLPSELPTSSDNTETKRMHIPKISQVIADNNNDPVESLNSQFVFL
jgi:hypothetical protein